MRFQHGDRVRWSAVGEDGFPMVRYGFVRAMAHESGPVIVLFDGDIAGEAIDPDHLVPVSITSVELHLDGSDLLDDPDLRRGLMSLWRAEAESAGLDVDAVDDMRVDPDDDRHHDTDDRHSWVLASLTSGGRDYVLRARRASADVAAICVRAEHRDAAVRND